MMQLDGVFGQASVIFRRAPTAVLRLLSSFCWPILTSQHLPAPTHINILQPSQLCKSKVGLYFTVIKKLNDVHETMSSKTLNIVVQLRSEQWVMLLKQRLSCWLSEWFVCRLRVIFLKAAGCDWSVWSCHLLSIFNQWQTKNDCINRLHALSTIINRNLEKKKLQKMLFAAKEQMTGAKRNYSCTDWLVNDCYYVQIWQIDEKSCTEIRPQRLPTASSAHLLCVLWTEKCCTSTCLLEIKTQFGLNLSVTGLTGLFFINLKW